MTLPSSRQRPWIFPDQRAHMKIHPMPQPEHQLPGPDLLSGHDAWHQEQMEAAHARVRSALTDNHHKEAYYLANAAFAPLTSRDSVTTRLKVHKNPEKMRGGVFTSKEGQAYGTNRLKERVSELNVRASAAFGVEAAQAQPSGPPGRDPEIMKMELALTTIVDDIQSGDVTSFQASARAFYSNLLAEGWRLGSSKISDFKGIIYNVRRDAIDIIEGPAPNQMGNRPGADQHQTQWVIVRVLMKGRLQRSPQSSVAGLSRAVWRCLIVRIVPWMSWLRSPICLFLSGSRLFATLRVPPRDSRNSRRRWDRNPVPICILWVIRPRNAMVRMIPRQTLVLNPVRRRPLRLILVQRLVQTLALRVVLHLARMLRHKLLDHLG